MRLSVVAVALALAIVAAAVVAPVILLASNHEREITGRQLQQALARHGVSGGLLANGATVRLIAGPQVVALFDDTRDRVGNGSLESGLSGTVLDSTRAANGYELGRTSGWLRLQKQNIVVEVTTSTPKLENEAIAAVRSLK